MDLPFSDSQTSAAVLVRCRSFQKPSIFVGFCFPRQSPFEKDQTRRESGVAPSMQTEGAAVAAKHTGTGRHAIRVKRTVKQREFQEERSEISIFAIRIAPRMSIHDECGLDLSRYRSAAP